jgi:DNA-binding LacI/PurR family transcriptional regulator
MGQTVKRRASELLAGLLQDEIGAGIYRDRLPGLRLLAGNFGVSVPTVSQSLHLLEAAGVVESGGDRRCWRVRGVAQQSAGRRRAGLEQQGKGGRLLFISARGLSGERFSGIECYAELAGELSHAGWDTLHRVLSFDQARRPHASWGRLVEVTRPDATIVLGGTPVMGTWMRQAGLRGLFLGGDAGTSGIPLLASDAPAMFEMAVKRLLASGHGMILIPFCGRPAAFVERCMARMKRALAQAGMAENPLAVINTPYSGPDVMANLLRKHWPLRKPDALIFLDWREFVAGSSFLHAHGVGIPRDVSVIILSHNPSMEWHLPRLCHFDLPARKLARSAARWVLTGELGKTTNRGQVMIPPRWVEGDSVANRISKR